MPSIVALYRYPMKGFTAEACDVLTVLDEGRIAGDRVLGLRFANSNTINHDWSKKTEFVVLMNTPGLACLNLQFDHKALRLRISVENSVLLDEALDDQGRERIAVTLENYVRQLDENPLSSHSERTPLRIVGDGVTARYQDSEAGKITLHSRESLAAVATAVGDTDLSEHRFRSNIVIEGLEAWEEQSWVGRKIRIGEVTFEVLAPKGRCLATHANPESGKRDLPILKTLTRAFDQKKPNFAIAMVTHGSGGPIHLGDEISLLD